MYMVPYVVQVSCHLLNIFFIFIFLWNCLKYIYFRYACAFARAEMQMHALARACLRPSLVMHCIVKKTYRSRGINSLDKLNPINRATDWDHSWQLTVQNGKRACSWAAHSVRVPLFISIIIIIVKKKKKKMWKYYWDVISLSKKRIKQPLYINCVHGKARIVWTICREGSNWN